MSKALRTRPVPTDSFGPVSAFGTPDFISDLVPPTVAPAPVKPVSSERQTLSTSELQLAVALIVNGYGEPEVTKIGKTQGGKPKVEFSFLLPEGKCARALEQEFWSKKLTGEISTIFSVTRALKKRIDRLADLAV